MKFHLVARFNYSKLLRRNVRDFSNSPPGLAGLLLEIHVYAGFEEENNCEATLTNFASTLKPQEQAAYGF